MTSGESIEARDIPDEGLQGREPGAGAAAGPAAAGVTIALESQWFDLPSLQEFKSVSERAFLVAKLRQHHWNISKTAEVIDTPRSNLYKKLEQYGISEGQDGQ